MESWLPGILIHAGADLSGLSGGYARFWTYTASHDQLYIDVSVGEKWGTLFMGGCSFVKLRAGWEFNKPAVTLVASSVERYLRFSDSANGVEIICRGILLDLDTPPCDMVQLVDVRPPAKISWKIRPFLTASHGFIDLAAKPFVEKMTSVEAVIAALRAFEPERDGCQNLSRLYAIFDGFGRLPDRAKAIPAILALIERCPDADFGSPGPLVQELEAIEGHRPSLRQSLRRRPACLTVWMVNRILNTELPAGERPEWLAELRWAAEHPNAPESAKAAVPHFLEHQAAVRRPE